MKRDELVLSTLGSHIAEQYLSGKEKEWDSYRIRITEWERDKYLYLY